MIQAERAILTRITMTMVTLAVAIVKKGVRMFMNSVDINEQPLKRKSHSFKMYCPNCCRFVQVTNTGLPCKVCGSESIVLASGWKPDLHVMKGGQANG